MTTRQRAAGAPTALPLSVAISAGVALLLWSTTAIANKFAVRYLDGVTAGVMRSLLAALLAMPIALLLRMRFPESLRDRVLLLTSGVSSFAIWPVMMSVGLARTTAGHAAFIMALIPAFTVLISGLWRSELPSLRWWSGTALALCAAGLLMLGGSSSIPSAKPASTVVGDVIVLMGGIVCALGYVTGAQLSPRIGAIATTFWGLSLALCVLLPTFGVIATHTLWSGVPIAGWLAIAWMAVLSSIIGYVLWFYALGHGGAGKIGSFQLATPVLTIIFAALLLAEAPSAPLLADCALLLAGTYIAHRYAP